MKFNIETNVPVPSAKEGLGSIYGFHLMEVGNSILFDGETRGTNAKPAIAARVYGHRHGWKFKTRSVEGGVRIWRVE